MFTNRRYNSFHGIGSNLFKPASLPIQAINDPVNLNKPCLENTFDKVNENHAPDSFVEFDEAFMPVLTHDPSQDYTCGSVGWMSILKPIPVIAVAKDCVLSDISYVHGYPNLTAMSKYGFDGRFLHLPSENALRLLLLNGGPHVLVTTVNMDKHFNKHNAQPQYSDVITEDALSDILGNDYRPLGDDIYCTVDFPDKITVQKCGQAPSACFCNVKDKRKYTLCLRCYYVLQFHYPDLPKRQLIEFSTVCSAQSCYLDHCKHGLGKVDWPEYLLNSEREVVKNLPQKYREYMIQTMPRVVCLSTLKR